MVGELFIYDLGLKNDDFGPALPGPLRGVGRAASPEFSGGRWAVGSGPALPEWLVASG